MLLDQVLLQDRVSVGGRLEQQNPLLASAELALVPEDRRDGSEDLRARGEPGGDG
jgi:hypothetical protein